MFGKRRWLCSFGMLLAFAACTDKAPLTAADKARFTAELIEKRPECAVYLRALSPSVTDAAVVDKAYQDARAANCIKPDV